MSLFFRRRRARSLWTRAHVAELVLLLAGFLCVGWFVFTIVDGRIYQSYESYRLDASVRGEQPTLSGYLRQLLSAEDITEKRARETETPAPLAPGPLEQPRRPPMEAGSTIGRIEIARIKLSAVVREGTDDKTLKRSAGHVPSTALPGDHGNVGIAAHRDSFFSNLRHVREGDVIRMTTTWGVYEYTVDSLTIVFPENVEVLDPTPAPSLTLVTCYPFNYVGSAPKRFIVRARQVNPPPVAASS